MRKLVYYIATSIDGYIADTAGDFSHFPLDKATLDFLFTEYPETCPVHLREYFGVTAGPRRFDTVVMGHQTHLPAREAGLPNGAYPHLRQIVATHQDVQAAKGVETIEGDVAAKVGELRNEPGQDIWLCGGANLAGQLFDLIDEVQLKIYPILLGDGIPLFRGDTHPRHFQPVDFKRLPGGVTLATFRPSRQTTA